MRPKTPVERLDDYQAAARAYRQLAIALRQQGITEAADRFTYRALIMQRKARWWRLRSLPLLTQPNEQDTKQKAQSSRGPESQRRLVQRGWQWFTGMLAIGRLVGSYLFSWFLAVLTGYGFRKSRIALAYVPYCARPVGNKKNIACPLAWHDESSFSHPGSRETCLCTPTIAQEPG